MSNQETTEFGQFGSGIEQSCEIRKRAVSDEGRDGDEEDEEGGVGCFLEKLGGWTHSKGDHREV